MSLDQTFIKARDPSIILGKNFGNKRLSFDSFKNGSEDELRFQVYLRLKKFQDKNDNTLYSVNDNSLECFIPGLNQKTIYTFNKVFDTNCDQLEIFNTCVKAHILDFINGKDKTLMVYGPSGSGKTYTMLGNVNNPGIIPRALEYLFKTLPPLETYTKIKPDRFGFQILTNKEYQSEKSSMNNLFKKMKNFNKTVITGVYEKMQQRVSKEHHATLEDGPDSISVCISFLEIYNETIFDLLVPLSERQPLKISQVNEKIDVKLLTRYLVNNGAEAYQLLEYGRQNLKYASTNVNDHSSRSHCIFIVELVQAYKSGNHKISCFKFSDLAGSERVKNTLNEGQRLKESSNINTSLHVFGKCLKVVHEIQKLNDPKTIIPFRESKLTLLFKNSLLRIEETLMIVNLFPIDRNFDENIHVLNFSAIAKEIIIQPKNQIANNSLQTLDALMDSLSSVNSDTTLMSLIEQEAQRRFDALKSNFDLEIRKEALEFYTEEIKLKEERFAKKLESQKMKYENEIENLKRQLKENNESDGSFETTNESIVEILSSSEDEQKIKIHEELEKLKLMNEDLRNQIRNKDEENIILQEKCRKYKQYYERVKHESNKMKNELNKIKKELEQEKIKNHTRKLEPTIETHETIIPFQNCLRRSISYDAITQF